MAQNNTDLTLKILILGKEAVGKTCFIRQSCLNTYSAQYSMTVGVDFCRKETKIEGRNVILHVWDTAGQERYRTIARNQYIGTQGILVAYSVDDRQSFNQISYWMRSILDFYETNKISIVLIANKSDSQNRVISPQEGVELAQQYNVPFFETSALLDRNCQAAIDALARLCFRQAQEAERLNNQNNNNTNVRFQLTSEKRIEKKKCC